MNYVRIGLTPVGIGSRSSGKEKQINKLGTRKKKLNIKTDSFSFKHLMFLSNCKIENNMVIRKAPSFGFSNQWNVGKVIKVEAA